MTRKDYELITMTLAQALNEERYEPVNSIGLVIRQFIDVLSADNGRFSGLQMIDSIQAMNVNPRAIDLISKIRNEQLSKLPEVKEF